MVAFSALFTGFRSVVGFLIPPLKKVYFDRPKLYIVLKLYSSSSFSRGLSGKNDFTNPLLPGQAIHHFEQYWEYEVIVRNNSDFNAYNLKLIEPVLGSMVTIEPAIDSYKPILANAETVTHLKFHNRYEGTGAESTKMIKSPAKYLTDGKFVLEYTNVKGTKCYTIYDCSQPEEERHVFSRILPKGQLFRLIEN